MIDFLTFFAVMPFIPLIETFQDREWLFFAFFLLFSAMWVVLYLLLLAGIVYLLDSAFVPKREVLAKLVSKKHTPSHYVTSIVQVGKVPVPMRHRVPATWHATVEHNGAQSECAITRRQFAYLQNKSHVRALIGHGRLTGSMYCKDVLIG